MYFIRRKQSVQISELSHFQQLLFCNLEETPAFLGGEICCSSSLVELNRLCIVFCYDEVHAATAGLHGDLEEEKTDHQILGLIQY